MKPELMRELPAFLDALGLDEDPLGILFTDEQPEGLSPASAELPTRDKEQRGELDWNAQTKTHSCAMGHVWRARRKQAAAWFSSERFGCAGNAFWMGFSGPCTDTMLNYVTHGERYLDSPETYQRIADDLDPVAPPAQYVVFKPLSLFEENETPSLVALFARPESIAGLHQLAAFITGDPQVVASPWGPACGGLFTWPMRYLADGENRAALGGWDPSARKFLKTDEISFTVPFAMFDDMLTRWQDSFLTKGTWPLVQKKIARSKRAWEEV